MLEHGLKQRDTQIIQEAFEKFGADAEKVVVFGSRAKGTHKKGSDIDLAYKGHLTSEQKFQIKDYLEEENSCLICSILLSMTVLRTKR